MFSERNYNESTDLTHYPYVIRTRYIEIRFKIVPASLKKVDLVTIK